MFQIGNIGICFILIFVGCDATRLNQQSWGLQPRYVSCIFYVWSAYYIEAAWIYSFSSSCFTSFTLQSNLSYPDRGCYYNIAANCNSSSGNFGYSTYQGYWWTCNSLKTKLKRWALILKMDLFLFFSMNTRLKDNFVLVFSTKVHVLGYI